MGTFVAKPAEIERSWYIFDMAGQTLGRAASRIALVLRGKHKPEYTPHVNTGDVVVIINADSLVVTGDKLEKKNYYKHSQYPGGMKVTKLKDKMSKNSAEVVMEAVKGMLPKGPLGRDMLKNLKVYSGNEHPHEAQQPKELLLNDK